MNGLEKIYGGRVRFVRVNIHKPENQPLLDRFAFSTSPELWLVDDQETALGSWGEGVTTEELTQAFEEALNNGK